MENKSLKQIVAEFTGNDIEVLRGDEFMPKPTRRERRKREREIYGSNKSF